MNARNPRRKLPNLLLASLSGWATAGPTAQPPEAIETFYPNTLVCQNTHTHAICHAWFDLDGHYYVFYDLGPQKTPATPQGPFQFEGREGRYSARRVANGVQLCLRPLPPVALVAAANHELFSGADCYTVTPGPVGSRWEQTDPQGRHIVLWLLAGR